MIVVVMGVSGSGKTLIGRLLARRLGLGFSDADDFHGPENIRKMAGGHPLDDADREPWLRAMRAAIEGWARDGESRVLACSALKQAYREALSPPGAEVLFVYLRGSFELIERRLRARKEHFFRPELLKTQFDAMEEPAGAIVVDVSPEPEAIVERIARELPDKP